MKPIHINGSTIGEGYPCFIIAEVGINHNGDISIARQLVDVAVNAGADAVKFQTFNVDALTAPDAPKARYQAGATGGYEESQGDMLRKSQLPSEAFRELEAYCHERGIVFISTPFDHDSVDLLDSLGVPAFKVPSGEVVNIPLLRHIARKGKPIVLSTGMSYLSEVERAIRAIHDEGNDQLVVLHCVSYYPAEPKDINLRTMQTIRKAFDVPVGFSDHTLGIEIPIAAVAMGACVIEKHFTLDRSMPGPDHGASLEPHELEAMVSGIRNVEKALGSGVKQPAECETDTRNVARRSIYVRKPVEAGQKFTDDDLIALRPAGGISPDRFDEVVGRTARRPLPAGTAVAWRDLE